MVMRYLSAKKGGTGCVRLVLYVPGGERAPKQPPPVPPPPPALGQQEGGMGEREQQGRLRPGARARGTPRRRRGFSTVLG